MKRISEKRHMQHRIKKRDIKEKIQTRKGEERGNEREKRCESRKHRKNEDGRKGVTKVRAQTKGINEERRT